MDTAECLKRVRERNPLVHHITNYVTVNDCANACLAVGGSPVMADALERRNRIFRFFTSFTAAITRMALPIR